jgi:hypothetical protein
MSGSWTFLVAAHFLPLFGTCQSDEWVRHHIRLEQGFHLLHTGDTTRALATWDSAFAHLPWSGYFMFLATDAALVKGDTLRALGYLGSVYRAGGHPLLNYSDPIKGLLARGFEEPHLGRLLHAMDAWAAQADSVWITALLEMEELDQSVRSPDDPRMLHNDSLNLARLIRLTEERGFPSPDKVGSSFGIVQLLLWHHRGELGTDPHLDHYLQLVRRAMAAHQVAPAFLCGHYDFEAWENKEPMPYGTLIGYFRDQLEDVRLPAQEELDANRCSVGLVPIAWSAEVHDIPIDKLPFAR